MKTLMKIKEKCVLLEDMRHIGFKFGQWHLRSTNKQQKLKQKKNGFVFLTNRLVFQNRSHICYKSISWGLKLTVETGQFSDGKSVSLVTY